MDLQQDNVGNDDDWQENLELAISILQKIGAAAEKLRLEADKNAKIFAQTESGKKIINAIKLIKEVESEADGDGGFMKALDFIKKASEQEKTYMNGIGARVARERYRASKE